MNAAVPDRADADRLAALRRADVRFLAVREVSTAVAAAPGWCSALTAAGVDAGPVDGSWAGNPPDLAVVPRSGIRSAIGHRAATIVVDGRARPGPLRRAGYRTQLVLSLGSPGDPELFLPLDDARVVRYALQRWLAPPTRAKALRNGALAALLGIRVRVPGLDVLTLAQRQAGLPFLAAGAIPLGIPADARWFFATGRGDALSRGTIHLFRSGANEPSWIAKFSRAAGYRFPAERDEQGLSVVANAGGVAAAHAPRFLGRVDVGRHHVSVETAAAGIRLPAFLSTSASSRRKREALDRIAAWIVALSMETASEPGKLEPERRRLAEEVLPRWQAPATLVDAVPSVPAVLQHNDLGTWNLVTDGNDFTAIDWEDGFRHGLPLWDLAYFLADAAFELDRGPTRLPRVEHFLRLFRGELALSDWAFAHLARAVAGLSIPSPAVGPIVTLCWLHHGLSHVDRGVRLERHAPGMGTSSDDFGAMARLWLQDSALGPDWSRWRG